MQRSTAVSLLSFAAMSLATAGCTLERMDRAPAAKPAADAAAPAVAGQQLHLMFENEKRSAAAAELLAQS